MAAAFVGRARELELLAGLAARNVDCPVIAVLVQGDPGAGKSRLLEEFASSAAGGRCLRVAGHESERTVPLAGGSSLLRELVETGEGGAALERILGSEADESPSLDPLRVFEAAHRGLRRCGPVTLLVDDVQWVDPCRSR